MRTSISSPCLWQGAALAVVLAFTFAIPGSGDEPVAEPGKKATPMKKSGEAAVDFTDEGTLKVNILEAQIHLITPYGKLSIPVKDVKRIELGLRIPEKTAKEIEETISQLGSTEFTVRAKASARLLSLKEKGLPALKKATESEDVEVVRAAREILEKLQQTLSEAEQNLPPHDMVHTTHSQIAGHIEGTTFRASTSQFGEVQLRLADVRRLHFQDVVEKIDPSQITDAPPHMFAQKDMIGKVFYFRLTGQNTFVMGGLWGTDVYTADSSLALAAVHSGALQPGQNGVVKVTMVTPPAFFTSSTRNGITSGIYQNYPGAYKVEKVSGVK